MIELTRLNGNKFSINSDTIKYIEATPDTTISLTNGEKILVAETCETVVHRCVEYRAKVLRLAWPDARMFLSGKATEVEGGDSARAALASSSNS